MTDPILLRRPHKLLDDVFSVYRALRNGVIIVDFLLAPGIKADFTRPEAEAAIVLSAVPNQSLMNCQDRKGRFTLATKVAYFAPSAVIVSIHWSVFNNVGSKML